MDYAYTYAYEDGFGLGIAFYLIYMLVVCCFGIVMYVLRSAGVYSIARRRGINHAWLSWIPVADYWVLGCISDQYQYVVKGKNKSKRKVMLALNIVMAVLYLVMMVCYAMVIVNGVTGFTGTVAEDEIAMSMIGPLMGILGMFIPLMGVAIAVMVFKYMALYDLYTSCSPQNNVLFLVMSIIFNVTEPFFIFFNRKKDDGMPPRRPEPQAYIPPEPAQQENWNGPEM